MGEVGRLPEVDLLKPGLGQEEAVPVVVGVGDVPLHADSRLSIGFHSSIGKCWTTTNGFLEAKPHCRSVSFQQVLVSELLHRT